MHPRRANSVVTARVCCGDPCVKGLGWFRAIAVFIDCVFLFLSGKFIYIKIYGLINNRICAPGTNSRAWPPAVHEKCVWRRAWIACLARRQALDVCVGVFAAGCAVYRSCDTCICSQWAWGACCCASSVCVGSILAWRAGGGSRSGLRTVCS